MNKFVYHIPTKVFFGAGSIRKLGPAAQELGSKALLVYGGGSIKKNGIYDAVKAALTEAGIELFELSGVEPNPRLESVRKGTKLVRENGIDLLIAAGGGSTMDCSKAISACVSTDADEWDIIMNPKLIKAENTLPIIAIPTLAATGSEMDEIGVVSNLEIPLKKPLYSPALRPAVAIMDPEYTFTVSKFQTGSGTSDIYSHLLEVYFNRCTTAYVSDALCEGLLKTVLKYGKTAVDEPENYEARANLMWTSSLAINGLLKCGKEGHAWACHAIEHVASAYYDIAHGAGLAAITPHWMRTVLCDETVDKFVSYGVNVLGIDASLERYAIAEKAIDMTKEFFCSLGMPDNLEALGIPEDTRFKDMARDVVETGNIANSYYPLDADQVEDIFRKSWK